jgi:hypothetical protein
METYLTNMKNRRLKANTVPLVLVLMLVLCLVLVLMLVLWLVAEGYYRSQRCHTAEYVC